jgi:HEPN superfamily AbiU2-like protein
LAVSDYEYSVDDCDVPEVRRASLREYRDFRRKCLEYLHGDRDTSVVNQMYDLAWHTAVFRTLNEARRIEPRRKVNGAFWELTSAGYASLMTLGIRKLVDRDRRTDSVWNIIVEVERRPELLTREKFICYDGLPYDFAAVEEKYLRSIAGQPSSGARWMPTKGPDAWGTSEMMHRAFDRLAGSPKKRKRTDTIHPSVIEKLKVGLSHEAIDTVCTLADKRMAHAERLAEDAGPAPTATYADIDAALKQIVKVVNFLSSNFFYDTAFGAVVPTPEFDVLDGLDKPWITTKNVARIDKFWQQISNSMEKWAREEVEEFLPVTGVSVGENTSA